MRSRKRVAEEKIITPYCLVVGNIKLKTKVQRRNEYKINRGKRQKRTEAVSLQRQK